MTEKMPDEIYAQCMAVDVGRGEWDVLPMDGGDGETKYTRTDLMPQWNEDMESAPRDEWLLVALYSELSNRNTTHMLQFDGSRWFVPYRSPLHKVCLDNPIAWMPLPTPPQSGEKEGV